MQKMTSIILVAAIAFSGMSLTFTSHAYFNVFGVTDRVTIVPANDAGILLPETIAGSGHNHHASSCKRARG